MTRTNYLDGARVVKVRQGRKSTKQFLRWFRENYQHTQLSETEIEQAWERFQRQRQKGTYPEKSE